MTRLADIAGPWTPEDQRRLNAFLKETAMMPPPRARRPSNPLDALWFEADRTFTGWVPAEGKGPLHVSRLRRLERQGLAEVSQEHASTQRQWPQTYTVARPIGWKRLSGLETERRLRLMRICGKRPSPESLERGAGRPPAEEGPDSQAAHDVIGDAESALERERLERLRLSYNARWDTQGQLIGPQRGA